MAIRRVLSRSGARWLAVVAALFTAGHGQDPDMKESLEKYSPKACKYNLLPRTAGTRAYKNFMGEVHIYDVFGMPSAVKRHILRLDLEKESFITLQAEVHRDTPTTLTVDVYRRGAVGKPGGRILTGRNSMGAGGDDTKAFLHGLLNEKLNGEIDIVFELIAVEVAASQVDARSSEDRCWPVRLDLAVIPTSRSALHWPTSCPTESRLPLPLTPAGGEIITLPDKGLTLDMPEAGGDHFSFRFGDERPWEGFGRSVWSAVVEVPPRLHRFARFFVRTSFRFPSSPLQLVLELFDLKDTPNVEDTMPQCKLGCLGGVPVYNGQLLDHAMPTGFRYRMWVLAANLEEWTASLPDRGRHCVDFDLDYKVTYEQRLTPFEVGPSAWMCEFTRMPQRIVQTAKPSTDAKAKDNLQLVAGRTIWIRDRFGFPPEEVSDMEHKVELVIEEASIFRATTHHSDGVDVFMAITKKDESTRACAAVRHPGPVPRQTIFCRLQPGTYTLTVFADYPLGGLHPCSDFFAQIAIRPNVLNDAEQSAKCISTASDLSGLRVQRSKELTTTPNWKTMRVPIKFSTHSTTQQIWTQSIEILDGEEAQNLYLRLVVHSDYVSSDIRFQVKYEGKYIADTQVTSHGYADMIGPLDSGTYKVSMYYIMGIGPADMNLCSTSMVDLRLVSKNQYANRTAQWLCTSSRVPPPDVLSPQADEQILLDSEYVVPNSGVHTIRVKVTEPRLLRISATSADANFLVQLRTWPGLTLVSADNNHLEVLIGAGSFALRIKTIVRSTGNGAACSTMKLNLLLQPHNAVPQCPWSGQQSEGTAAGDDAQISASDHIGNLLLDLVPAQLSADTKPNPPVNLWMNQGMEKSFEMKVDSTAAVRLDVVVQPAFLPLVVTIRRQRPSGKLEPPIATAEWAESRLLLMQNDLPKGKYLVEFTMRPYMVHEDAIFLGEGAMSDICAHVTIFAEVGVASKEAINSMRAELLDLPDLLAVQPFLPNLNAVGWFSSPLSPSLGTQVYNFPEKSGHSMLTIEDKAIIRIVCEPADLSNAEANVKLTKMDGKEEVVASGDNLGQLVVEAEPGRYQLSMVPQAKAPFLVTVGVASMSRLKEDILLMDSSKPCLDTPPSLEAGVAFSPRGWNIGPTIVRLKQTWLTKTALLRVPIEITAASVLYIETGSNLPLDLIRISLEVPEGLWVGEQRGMRNSLQIELPPGKYVAHVGQPKPAGLSIKRCLDFSVYILATPINPDAAAEAEAAMSSKQGGSRKELTTEDEAAMETAPCFSMGTVPLPLDLSDPAGGSKILGGPLDKDGRLLVRQRVQITDMHDGRKKMYLKTKRKKLLMKVGVIIGGYAHLSLANQLTFTVQKIGATATLDPVESWSQESGWERIYLLEEAAAGFWLTFHHAHRERAESACLHFGLELEIHPYEDTMRMFTCPTDSDRGVTSEPEEMFPESFDIDQSDHARTTFKYSRGMLWLKQPQVGFLHMTRFTLNVRSYVNAELAHNYFLSHAEMDIVYDKDAKSPQAIATAENEFIHEAGHPMNARQVLGSMLEPGSYKLRIADDHYPSQLNGVDSACFPFSFEFRVVPEQAAPAIISVLPHPSVPIPMGVDLVMTIRFSEAPLGDIPDVVSKFSFGGFQASTGGSMNHMGSQYMSQQRTAKVTAETAEGHLVWIIGWSSMVLSSMGGEAKLQISQLRSNVSNRIFKFSPPTYKVVEAPRGSPWSGSSRQAASDSSSKVVDMPDPDVVPESGAVSSEGSASRESGAVSSEGSVRPEGSQAALADGSDGPKPEAAPTDAPPAQEPKAESSASSSSADGGLGEVKAEGAGEVKAETSSAVASDEPGALPEAPITEAPVTEAPTPPPTEAPPAPSPPSNSGASSEASSEVGAPRAESVGSVRAEGAPPIDTAKLHARLQQLQTSKEAAASEAEKAAAASQPSSSSSDSSKASTDVGEIKASSAVGEVGGVGMPKPEAGAVRAESSADLIARLKRHQMEDHDDHGDHGPQVQQWTPPQPPPAQSRMEDDEPAAQCPEGTKLNGDTGICDSAPVESGLGSIMSSMPSGYGSMLSLSAGSLVGLAVLMNCMPRLKGMTSGLASGLHGKSSGASLTPSARFQDIGHWQEEEERGLMSQSHNEDDML